MTYPIVIQSPHFPPTSNSMFINVPKRGRVKTAKYRTWITAAGWDCNGKGRCSGPFKLVVSFNTKNRRPNADLDNRIKPTLDLLVTQNVVDDDRHCEAIMASWSPLPDDVAFRAEIWPVRA